MVQFTSDGRSYYSCRYILYNIGQNRAAPAELVNFSFPLLSLMCRLQSFGKTMSSKSVRLSEHRVSEHWNDKCHTSCEEIISDILVMG